MPQKKLSQALDEQYAEFLLRQTEMIRNWPASEERTRQAEIYVRTALLDQIRGRIRQDVLYRVYSILSFAMPDDAALEDETMPIEELEREADWETAYHEQLERRGCPECGDGLCPPR